MLTGGKTRWEKDKEVHFLLLNCQQLIKIVEEKIPKPGMVEHFYNSSTVEVEVEGLEVQGQSGLQTKYQVSLGYIKTL
jgi:hypothetical protein